MKFFIKMEILRPKNNTEIVNGSKISSKLSEEQKMFVSDVLTTFKRNEIKNETNLKILTKFIKKNKFWNLEPMIVKNKFMDFVKKTNRMHNIQYLVVVLALASLFILALLGFNKEKTGVLNKQVVYGLSFILVFCVLYIGVVDYREKIKL